MHKDKDQREGVILVKGLAKYFAPSKGQRSIKQLFTSSLRFEKKHRDEGYWALKDINFEVKKGEFFGVVGRNGSGKSTLLKIIAGVYSPTKGSVTVNGKLVPFIELGVGFNAELNGRDNVYLNGALLGFSRKEIADIYDEIVSFAELEDHMDVKLKNFSSGMQVRLAFSIAIRARSDILLLDEVLAVGDAAFQSKCFDYFYKLKKQGATVVLVSHDRSALERFCEKGILINDGKITAAGPIKKVLVEYSKIVMDELGQSDEKNEEPVDSKDKYKSRYASIQNVRAQNGNGVTGSKFVFGEPIKISYEVIIKDDIVNPILGVTIWQKNNNKAVFAANTLIDGIKETGSFKKGDRIYFETELPTTLNDGEFYIEPAIANESASVFYDQKINASSFRISGSLNPHSIISSAKKIKLIKKRI
jgi:ABC-type polysaccharide/polyol phosphate transport system ATPase subunit